MNTLSRDDLNSDTLEQLDTIAKSQNSPKAMKFFSEMTSILQSGGTIEAGGNQGESDYTPASAAKKIGVSRTYICKLLDRGIIPSHRVGSHRRIKAADLAVFSASREASNERTAGIIANRSKIRSAAANEIIKESTLY
ncbi:excisionase family DNA-binding protein [Corynebacterium variabile]|uniref:excisionase family DNA-binding protein n=1 Tax=Corynebacterium variabile TaxID=1727 RepID=UPI003FD3CC8C